MKKELILLNELSSLFLDGRQYKIEYVNLNIDLNKGVMCIEFEFTEEELIFVKKMIKGKIIDGHGIVMSLPIVDINFEKINKCICFMFVLEGDLWNFKSSIDEHSI